MQLATQSIAEPVVDVEVTAGAGEKLHHHQLILLIRFEPELTPKMTEGKDLLMQFAHRERRANVGWVVGPDGLYEYLIHPLDGIHGSESYVVLGQPALGALRRQPFHI